MDWVQETRVSLINIDLRLGYLIFMLIIDGKLTPIKNEGEVRYRTIDGLALEGKTRVRL